MTAGESRKAPSTAQLRLARLAGAATNEAAPLTRAAQYLHTYRTGLDYQIQLDYNQSS